MVASIVGTVSRAQAGLVSPQSRSFNINASQGGIASHWGGTRQFIGNHPRCLQIWRAWQNYHMNTHGWVDIGYNFGYCNHGYVFAGRGAGVRSAAQGTTDGNNRFEAAVWIGGNGDGNPTTLALNALEWIVWNRRNSGVGREVRSHNSFTGTSCAGTFLNNYIKNLHNRNINLAEDDMPSADEIAKAVIDTLRSERFNYYWEGRLKDGSWPTERFDTMTSRTRSRGERAYVVLSALQAEVKVIAKKVGVNEGELASAIAKELKVDLNKLADKLDKDPNTVTAEEIIDELSRRLMD